uniref:Uncharacterized protein n=1 Tax=Meloidogyne incognita TaxID=6306 RepID=A0A914KNX1_MELIC
MVTKTSLTTPSLCCNCFVFPPNTSATKIKMLQLRKQQKSLKFPCFSRLNFSTLFFSLLQIILFCGCLPSVSSYFVLARYSTLPVRQHLNYNPHYFSKINQKINPLKHHWNAQQKIFSSLNLPFVDKEKEEINEGKHFKNDLEQHSFANKQKRTSIISEHLSEHEHVCTTIIRRDYAPTRGHDKDNNPVEIQQDERRQFIATFIECANSKGDQCHGIDDLIYSSKCVTVYELRPAGIRMEGDVGDFVDGVIRVPITCQCQLYRRLFVGNTD